MQLQFEMSAITQTMNRELVIKRNDIDAAMFGCKTEADHLSATVTLKEKQISDNEMAIEAAEKKRSELGNQYKDVSARSYNETLYLFHEEEWVFDENSTICKSCGQTLQADKIEQIKADFEARKAKAKADAVKKLEDAKSNFLMQRESDLEEIKALGFKQKDIVEELTSKNETLKNEVSDLKKKLEEVLTKKSDLEKQLEEIPSKVDYMQNEEYAKLKERHDTVKAEIAKVESTGHDELMAQFEEEKKELADQLDAVRAEIAKAANNIEVEERIAELEKEQREVGQKVADQEKMIYLLDKFIQMKMDMVSDEINKHFRHVSFRLFKEQLNGGIVPTCEIKYVKESRGDLNNGHRIVAGLDIIQSLSELYGVTAPIFVDNAESLNEFNVPDMAAQMILLAVSDDKELKVEV